VRVTGFTDRLGPVSLTLAGRSRLRVVIRRRGTTSGELRVGIAKRIQQADTALFKVPGVAGDKRKLMSLRCCGNEHVGLFAHDALCSQLTTKLTSTTCDVLTNRQNFMVLKELLHPHHRSLIRAPVQSEKDLLNGDDGHCKLCNAVCPLQDALIDRDRGGRAR